MQLDKDYLDKCPDLMSKEQFRLACRISKRTALYYLQAGLIPHINTGKGTHKYLIRKKDVINFLKKRSADPQKYLPPENWYKYNTLNVCDFTDMHARVAVPVEAILHEFYTTQLNALPDVLDPLEIAEFTGYDRKTVIKWIAFGKLKSLRSGRNYIVPKCYLIDWLCSAEFNSIITRSRRHNEMLKAMNR